jgi:hypothetical protein
MSTESSMQQPNGHQSPAPFVDLRLFLGSAFASGAIRALESIALTEQSPRGGGG